MRRLPRGERLLRWYLQLYVHLVHLPLMATVWYFVFFFFFFFFWILSFSDHIFLSDVFGFYSDLLLTHGTCTHQKASPSLQITTTALFHAQTYHTPTEPMYAVRQCTMQKSTILFASCLQCNPTIGQIYLHSLRLQMLNENGTVPSSPSRTSSLIPLFLASEAIQAP